MKKKFTQRILCAALAVLMLCPMAFASDAYGDEIYRSNITLGQSTTLSRGTFWSDTYSTTRGESYIAYTPNLSVIPVVSYGGSIVSTTSMAAVSAELEAKGMTLAGGINGDYFVMASGESLGMLVTDSVLRSTSTYLPALGFRADGSAVIGYPNTKTTVTTPAGSFGIADINKSRTGANCVLFTPDFSATTLNTKSGIDVIIENLSGDLSIGGTVTGTVREVVRASGATPIPAGCFVLSLADDSGDTWRGNMMSSLLPGDAVSVTVAADDPLWSTVTTALGGMYVLVENGTAKKGIESSTPPRTAVGVKADGTVLFYNAPSTTDGAATTLDQVAVRLVELGCVSAICLDGGGSSTLAAAYPGSQTYSIVNNPSGGSLRSCSNYLVLASTVPADGIARSLWLYPYDVAVLTGARVDFTAKAADSAYRAAAVPGDLSYTVSGRGTVSADGVYYAGNAGADTVTVNGGGLIPGTALVRVTSTPDSITLKNQATGAKIGSTLNIQPEETVDLTAVAYSNHIDLISQDTCFTWSLTGDAGTITDEGVFTAGAGGTGILTVSAGGTSTTVKISVRSNPIKLANFENDVLSGAPYGVTLSLESASDLVAFGRHSMKVQYDLIDGSAGVYSAGIKKPIGKNYLTFSVYGDGSGNSIAAVIDGIATKSAVLNFTGWKTVSIAVDREESRFDGFVITGSGSGTVYIDQVVAATSSAPDTTTPAIEVSVSGGVLSAVITDNTTDECEISLTCDGKAQSISVDGGIFKYSVPSSSGVHKLTVTAVDAYGNRSDKSVAVGSSDAENPFADMSGHWSAQYVDYLYSHGIVNGSPSGGKLYYNPDKNMTRSEFAVIVSNWLGIDTAAYANVTLPFSDADSIPSWALNSVKTMYSLGILKGTANGSKLVFNQGGAITRAEAFTIIGRTQAKGYAKGSMNFSDASKVPSWASEHMSTLIARGVVSGYNGRLEPTANVTRAQVAKILYSLI